MGGHPGTPGCGVGVHVEVVRRVDARVLESHGQWGLRGDIAGGGTTFVVHQPFFCFVCCVRP